MDQDIFLRSAMEAHGKTIYRLALCRTQNETDAEDVYQDVFLKLLKELGTENWTSEHLKAWLIRITINCCNDLHRTFWRRNVISLDAVTEHDEGVTEDQSELWDVVGQLPAKYRVIVHLFYAEGYSTDEIAELAGIPAATVRSRMHRARKQLKKELGGYTSEK